MTILKPAAALVLVLAFTAPLAAQDAATAIAERQDRMEAVGDAAEIGGNMARERAPFDAATAAQVFRDMNESATGFAALFPEGSEAGGDTEAAPAIFTDRTGFEAAVAKFEADTAAALAAAPQDLASFQTAFQGVAGNCRACHSEYRVD